MYQLSFFSDNQVKPTSEIINIKKNVEKYINQQSKSNVEDFNSLKESSSKFTPAVMMPIKSKLSIHYKEYNELQQVIIPSLTLYLKVINLFYRLKLKRNLIFY